MYIHCVCHVQPTLPADDIMVSVRPAEEPLDVEVLIVGAGPAGLTAATELGKLGIQVMLIDDKDRVGGKLVLQTHKFFGTKVSVSLMYCLMLLGGLLCWYSWI